MLTLMLQRVCPCTNQYSTTLFLEGDMYAIIKWDFGDYIFLKCESEGLLWSSTSCGFADTAQGMKHILNLGDFSQANNDKNNNS